MLFGTIAGGGIIGAYLRYDNKAEVELTELSGKDADLFRATCKGLMVEYRFLIVETQSRFLKFCMLDL